MQMTVRHEGAEGRPIWLPEVPCCTRDEGRSLGIGLQDQIPNHPEAAWVKSPGGERTGKRRAMSSSGEDGKDERE